MQNATCWQNTRRSIFVDFFNSTGYHLSQQYLDWFWAKKKLNFDTLWRSMLRWKSMIPLNNTPCILFQLKQFWNILLSRKYKWSHYWKVFVKFFMLWKALKCVVSPLWLSLGCLLEIFHGGAFSLALFCFCKHPELLLLSLLSLADFHKTFLCF